MLKVKKNRVKKYMVMFSTICLFTMPHAYAQTDISSRIELVRRYLGINLDEAKRILNSVDTIQLKNEPDSIQYLYHYYSASAEELQGKSSLGKMKHLEIAKMYSEKKLGVYNTAYMEICWILGSEYKKSGQTNKAIGVWEEGLVNGVSFLSRMDEKQRSAWDSILHELSSEYKKKGLSKLSNQLWQAPTDGIYSIDDASELINETIKLIEDGKVKDCIPLLKEAESILPNCENEDKDWKILMGPVYAQYLTVYSELSMTQQIDSILPLYKKIKQKYSETKSYYDVFSNIITRLASHRDYQNAMVYMNKAKSLKDEMPQETFSQLLNLEKNLNRLIGFQQHIDSLETAVAGNKTDTPNWNKNVDELMSCYLRTGEYDKALDLSIKQHDNLKSKGQGKNDLFWKSLNYIRNICIKEKKYDVARPYFEESEQYAITVYGKESTEYGWVCNDLSILNMDSNRILAKQYLNKAHAIIKHAYGEDSAEMASVFHNEGRFYQLTGNLKIAKQLLTQSKDIQLKVSGNVNPQTEKYLSEVEHALSPN